MEVIKFEDSASHYHSDYDPQFYDIVSYGQSILLNSRTDVSCQRCSRFFPDAIAKLQHLKYSSKHNVCCSHDFVSSSELLHHFTNSPKHSYCEKCTEHFAEEGRGPLYWHHIMNSPNAHHFCRPCSVELDTLELLDEHLELVHFCCVRCEKLCETEKKLEVHRQVSERHWICQQCLRDFPMQAQLSQHQKIHRERNITCPVCGMGFCSNSGLIIHWENNTACIASRDLITQAILQFDDKSELIPPSTRKYIYSYNSHRVKRADEARDWNSGTEQWECSLCGGLFLSFEGLDRHLQSPFHDARVYKCNGCDTAGRERWFNSLSGLVQHVEDTGCGNGGKGEYAKELMEFLRNAVAS